MKRTLWAALAVFLVLGLSGQSAFAGGYGYGSGYYAGTDIYVARASAPVYDCPRPGCRTDIRLRAGSSIYAICWDGGEGWCKVQTRYFKNMFLPRYALDLAYGGHHYKSYYYKEAYPKSYGYKDCYYKEKYYNKGSYGEGCYDKYDSPDKGYSYKGGGYKYGAYSSGYDYKRSYRREDYSSSGEYERGEDYQEE